VRVFIFAVCLWFAWPSSAGAAEERLVRAGAYDNQPIVFQDSPGHYQGIAVDVLNYVAKKEHWRVIYVGGTLPDLLQKLRSGDIDVLLGVAYSEDRARHFQFTDESLIGNWGIVYKRPQTDIVSPIDLRGRRVALLRDSVHAGAFADLLRRFRVRYHPVWVDSYDEVLARVEDGEADAGVVSRTFGSVNAPRYEVIETGIVFNPVYVHFAAPPGADPAIIDALDRYLTQLKADKTSAYYASLERWLETHPERLLPAWLQWAIAILAVVLVLAIAIAALFRKQVRVKTRELYRKEQELEDAADQRRLAQEQLNQLAYFDSLTGLPNRLSFTEDFGATMQEADREGGKVAVLLVDLDRFKTINDSLGHGAGDVLLRLVGSRLHASLRSHDSIHRFGGDEFVIVITRIASIETLERVAERLLASLGGAIDLGSTQVYITASMGIAVYPDDDRSLDGILKDADTAMYQAKEQGGNRYQFYNQEFTTRVMERFRTDTRLRQGLERDELCLYYQPIFDLQQRRVVGMEALLRWNDPLRGLIEPATFVPLAEDTGLIVPIGEWVLSRACAQARAWQRDGLDGLRLSVNVSTRQFQRGQLVASVRRVLRQTGLDPEFLELEITEGLLLVLSAEVRGCLSDLQALGVRLVLDDFGTGYSGLSYLKQLPFHTLKVDRSFVQGIPNNSSDTQIASTILAMAESLGLDVTAEGIETEEQLAFLQARGCEFGQGHLLARPMAPRQFETWLQKFDMHALSNSPAPG
jgi:diguanylate cyclase (GGDEF)-like protein